MDLLGHLRVGNARLSAEKFRMNVPGLFLGDALAFATESAAGFFAGMSISSLVIATLRP